MQDQKPKTETKECFGCEIKYSDSDDKEVWSDEEVYRTPFDKEGRTVHFCSVECRENELQGSHDFAYLFCDTCDRWICQRNMNNGWDTFFVRRRQPNR